MHRPTAHSSNFTGSVHSKHRGPESKIATKCIFYKGSDCLTEMKKKWIFRRVFFFALAYCKNWEESNRIRLRSLGMLRIRICDPRSFRSQCIKATDESLSKVDSLVPPMHHYELLRSIIWIMVPKDSISSLLSPTSCFSTIFSFPTTSSTTFLLFSLRRHCHHYHYILMTELWRRRKGEE